MALVACLYFAINTVLVSGVLSILEGKSLREVCQQWYLWSFRYYLVGATSRAASWQPSLLALPLMALVFISCRLDVTRAVEKRTATT